MYFLFFILLKMMINKRKFLEEEDLDYQNSGSIHFAGEVILEPENSYHFRYDPQEQPERSILKGNNEKGVERKSYLFDKLKNIEGKIIKKFKDESFSNNYSNETSFE